MTTTLDTARDGGSRRHPSRRPAHDLLRLATAGSVDDGKSTLVGRLLYDTKSVLADQLDAVERVSRERGLDAADLALLTDGLRAEREQGITIDVAYRYFSTATRSFVLADTPGHVQYTRNMVTGASTAELALVLVDARHGVLEQTRRHLAVTGLLRVPHVVVAVNKMDLVDWDRGRFDDIVAEFRRHAGRFGIDDVVAVPVSALFGDNVVDRSDARALVRRADPARAPRGRAGRLRPGRPAAAAAGAGRHPPAGRASTATTAGTPGGSPPASCDVGDEVVVLPHGARTTRRRHRPSARGGRLASSPSTSPSRRSR